MTWPMWTANEWDHTLLFPFETLYARSKKTTLLEIAVNRGVLTFWSELTKWRTGWNASNRLSTMLTLSRFPTRQIKSFDQKARGGAPETTSYSELNTPVVSRTQTKHGLRRTVMNQRMHGGGGMWSKQLTWKFFSAHLCIVLFFQQELTALHRYKE